MSLVPWNLTGKPAGKGLDSPKSERTAEERKSRYLELPGRRRTTDPHSARREVPESLEQLANLIVTWDADNGISALDGTRQWEQSHESPRSRRPGAFEKRYHGVIVESVARVLDSDLDNGVTDGLGVVEQPYLGDPPVGGVDPLVGALPMAQETALLVRPDQLESTSITHRHSPDPRTAFPEVRDSDLAKLIFENART